MIWKDSTPYQHSGGMYLHHNLLSVPFVLSDVFSRLVFLSSSLKCLFQFWLLVHAYKFGTIKAGRRNYCPDFRVHLRTWL
jgi:hypothetical protein